MTASSDELVHLLAMVKEKWGVLINDAEATTDWTFANGTGSIVTTAVDTANKAANYKEYGSLELKATGTCDTNGKFVLKYNPSGTWDFTGASTEEYASGWLTYFSYWVKGTKAGTIRCVLTDSAGKTATWDNTITANQQKYFHLTLASPDSSDSGFDLTIIDYVQIGYISRTTSEGSMELHLDGLRVQGDPTFDTIMWTTTPIDDKMSEPVIAISSPKTFPSRRRGYSSEIAEEVIPLCMGPTPVTLIKRPLRAAYQLISDPTSNRSEGKIRKWRDYIYKELRRIFLKYPTYKAAQGLSYIEYISHIEDDNYASRPIRTRGYLDLRIFLFRNNTS